MYTEGKSNLICRISHNYASHRPKNAIIIITCRLFVLSSHAKISLLIVSVLLEIVVLYSDRITYTLSTAIFLTVQLENCDSNTFVHLVICCP